MSALPRIARIAKALCVEWRPGADVIKHNNTWWLVGVAGGDHPLPRTSGCATLLEALDAAEAWLAPELDRGRAGDRCGVGNQCNRLGCPECQQ